MRAAVVTAPGLIEVKDVADPVALDHQAVVAVDLCGICGTDVHVLDGDYGVVRYPVIPGHEFGGRVVAVGSAVRDLRVGQRVAVDPMDYCDACATCRAGWTNMCLRGGGLGTTAPGALAELVAVTAARCEPLTDAVPPSVAGLVEPLACVLHAADRVGPVLGSRALVLGAGPIGLLACAVLTRAGARVDVVERDAVRRGLARSFGAAETGARAEDLDRTWEVTLDATGNPAAVADAVGVTERCGRIALLGVSGPGRTFAFEPFDVVARELTIVGVNSVRHTFGRSAALLGTDFAPVELLHDEPLPLDAVATALGRTRSGVGGKTRVLVGAA